MPSAKSVVVNSHKRSFKGFEGALIPFGAIKLLAGAVGRNQEKFYGSLIRIAAFTSESKRIVTRADVLDICRDKFKKTFVRQLNRAG